MVYWSNTAYEDIAKIFYALANWSTRNGQKHLSFDHVVKYYDDLYYAFNNIDTLSYHTPVRYTTHAKFGQYAYRYQRNRRTSWYGIYDRYETDCFLNKILSNYRTISGIK